MLKSKRRRPEIPGGTAMNAPSMTRRHCLAAGAAALAFGSRPASAQLATIRQGYQTNIWGMPTYYLLKSGALEKRGLKFEEFAVASGNITMQQMVARQADMGTYAAQSRSEERRVGKG